MSTSARLALVFGVFLLLFACEACERSPSPAATDPAPKSSVAPTPTPDVAPPASTAPPVAPENGKSAGLVVSFISPGDGTDHAAYDRLQALLKTLAKAPPFVSHRWGKEGEHDECFDLSSLSVADRRAFVSKVTQAIHASKKVTVTENGTCQEGR